MRVRVRCVEGVTSVRVVRVTSVRVHVTSVEGVTSVRVHVTSVEGVTSVRVHVTSVEGVASVRVRVTSVKAVEGMTLVDGSTFVESVEVGN